MIIKRIGGGENVYVRHGEVWHYVGPLNNVNLKEILTEPTTPLRGAQVKALTMGRRLGPGRALNKIKIIRKVIRVRGIGASGVVLIAISIIAIAMLPSAINAIPSPLLTKRIGFVGLVNYYVSQPIPDVTPGLTVRVFLVNGSTIEPASALIDVYANTPSGIVELARGFGTALNVPFNNPNWVFTLERWAAIDAPFTEYSTSLIVFVTYVDGNHSWIEPIVVPYNVGWALSALGPAGVGSGVPRYIVLNAYVNVNKVKPQTVRIIRSMDHVADPQVFGEYEGYVVYNCNLSGLSPPILLQPYFEYVPTAMCIGLNGSIPYVWVTWSRGILSTDNATDISLVVDFAGTLNWHAMAVGYGDVGTSYSADEDWVVI